MNAWATIIVWEGAEPAIRRESARQRVTIAFVPSVEAAARAAAGLAAEGVELIELCGGFGVEGGSAVSRAVAGRAAVGVVAYGIESLERAAAFKARFDAP